MGFPLIASSLVGTVTESNASNESYWLPRILMISSIGLAPVLGCGILESIYNTDISISNLRIYLVKSLPDCCESTRCAQPIRQTMHILVVGLRCFAPVDDTYVAPAIVLLPCLLCMGFWDFLFCYSSCRQPPRVNYANKSNHPVPNVYILVIPGGECSHSSFFSQSVCSWRSSLSKLLYRKQSIYQLIKTIKQAQHNTNRTE